MKVSPIALMFLFASNAAAFSQFGPSTSRSSGLAGQRTIEAVEGGVVVRQQQFLSDQELRYDRRPILNGDRTEPVRRPTWVISSSTKQQVEPTSERTPVATMKPQVEKKPAELDAHVVMSRVAMLREKYRREQEQKANGFKEAAPTQQDKEIETPVAPPQPIQTEAVIPKETATIDDPELLKMHERVNTIRERYLAKQEAKVSPKPTTSSGSSHFVGHSPTALQAVASSTTEADVENDSSVEAETVDSMATDPWLSLDWPEETPATKGSTMP